MRAAEFMPSKHTQHEPFAAPRCQGDICEQQRERICVMVRGRALCATRITEILCSTGRHRRPGNRFAELSSSLQQNKDLFGAREMNQEHSPRRVCVLIFIFTLSYENTGLLEPLYVSTYTWDSGSRGQWIIELSTHKSGL